MRLIQGHMLSQCVYVVAKLGVVDAIESGAAMHVDEIAERVGARPDPLHRVLRALAAEGLFTEVEPRTFAVTEQGELLRDHDRSMRYIALLHGEQTFGLFTDLIETVRTGVPVPILRTGRSRWQELADDPEQSEVFNLAMRGRAAPLVEVASAVGWDDVATLVDVGGGSGGVLLPLLQREQHLRGVLFDLPHVIDDARGAIAAASLADRCTVASGDFFESVPGGEDAYLLSNVLHDWEDADAVRIVATCRAASRPDSILIILENLVPEGDEPAPAKVMDLQMLVALGGRERTEAEFGDLLAGAGFELDRVVGESPAALVARPV
jgi:hypothetical protein